MLLAYLWYNNPCILTQSPLLSTISCHSLPVLPLVGILILGFTELNYLFFRISCHSIWPISHVHTILIERCAFLYALITNAPISFPTFFIHSLVEVHRSSVKSHGLFFPVFIHRILLNLGLKDFLASKPVHIIAPIGATFLRQRVA